MISPKVNTGFSWYSDEALEIKAELIVTSMTGKPEFPSPHPELDAATAALSAYTTALFASKSGNKTDIVIKKQKKKELIRSLTMLGHYVNFIANGDITILSLSKFDIRKNPVPLPDVHKPEIILIEDGLNAGELQVTIKKVLGARSYIFQYTTTDPTLETTTWTSEMSVVIKYVFKNLQSGQRYWCRVAAVGSKDKVAYGDPVFRIAQ